MKVVAVLVACLAIGAGVYYSRQAAKETGWPARESAGGWVSGVPLVAGHYSGREGGAAATAAARPLPSSCRGSCLN
jgi:hypothetical protein